MQRASVAWDTASSSDGLLAGDPVGVTCVTGLATTKLADREWDGYVSRRYPAFVRGSTLECTRCIVPCQLVILPGVDGLRFCHPSTDLGKCHPRAGMVWEYVTPLRVTGLAVQGAQAAVLV